MSDQIRPSEISEVLLAQLKDIDTDPRFEEVGTVLQVSDGVVRIHGLKKAEAGELLEFEDGIKAVVMNLEEDNVGAVLLGPTDKIKEGMTIRRTRRIASLNVGEGMVGRVVNPLGEPLDGKGRIEGELCEMPLERKAPGVIFRQPVTEPLQTGLKAIDSMIPIGRGQRELIIGDRQTGKTAIAIDTIINQRAAYEAGEPVFCIYGCRSERIYYRQSGADSEGKGCNGLYYCRCCYSCRSCCTPLLRSVCRCGDRRVFP